MVTGTRTGWIYILCNESDADHVRVLASIDHPEKQITSSTATAKTNPAPNPDSESDTVVPSPSDHFEIAAAFLFADKVSDIEQRARELLKPHQHDDNHELYSQKLPDAEAYILRASLQFKQDPATIHRPLKFDYTIDTEQAHDCALKTAKIAARHGDPEAQFYLAVCYADGAGVSQDHKEAARWYRKAAERGHADAQDNLGVCFDHGKGVDQNHLEATLWFKEAAKQGSASAQMNLGHCYYEGRGVKKNEKESIKLWHQAAAQGSPAAQLHLGVCYTEGRGLKTDHEQALGWYLKAAEQNHSKAQATLAKCYLDGNGTEQDPSNAKHWLEQAIAQGFEDSENLLDKIIEQRATSLQLIATESDRLSQKPSIPEINAITTALDKAYPDWQKKDNAHYQLIENLYDNFEHLR